jgi:protease-4
MRPKRLRRTALALLALAVGTLGCVSINLPGTMPEPLMETTVRGVGDAKILLLSIDGVMQESAGPADFFGISQESPISRLRDELDYARYDPAIRGILLRINSPGGTVTAAEILYDEIRRFKAERGLPIVAQFMGIAASGGYYVAMAADEIVAYPTTVTGSIGVIMSLFPNLTGLMEKIGVKDQTLVTGAFKDTGSSTRPMRSDERAQMQSVIDDLFLRFVEVVEQGRKKLSREKIEELADGRIYSARQAKEVGLVDHVGDIEVALERLRVAAGLSEVRVIRYHRSSEYQSNLFTRSNAPRVAAPSALPVWPELRGPGFFYLWAPGSAE